MNKPILTIRTRQQPKEVLPYDSKQKPPVEQRERTVGEAFQDLKRSVVNASLRSFITAVLIALGAIGLSTYLYYDWQDHQGNRRYEKARMEYIEQKNVVRMTTSNAEYLEWCREHREPKREDFN